MVPAPQRPASSVSRQETYPMSLSARWALIPALVAGWLAFAGPGTAWASKASDPPFKVKDEGGFFSELAKDKANREIAEIKRLYGKDVLVETSKTAPPGYDRVKGDDPAVRKLLAAYAKQRFDDSRVNGIYIYISRQA